MRAPPLTPPPPPTARVVLQGRAGRRAQRAALHCPRGAAAGGAAAVRQRPAVGQPGVSQGACSAHSEEGASATGRDLGSQAEQLAFAVAGRMQRFQIPVSLLLCALTPCR